MKKIYFFAILFIFNFSLRAQTTAIPDSQFEAALIDLGIDSDGTINGMALTADLEEVTELDVSWIVISDLTGIEAFSSLEVLNCSFLMLSELDVSDNTLLVELRLAGNGIDVLDVSSLSQLEILDFVGNSITEIDLSANPLLHTLWALDNQLTELDVSANPNLTLLGCWENKLTTLDVSNNPALTTLHCYSNKLEHLIMNNGNNTDLIAFNATNNPDLECIMVDDSTYAADTFTLIDDQSYFSVDCFAGLTPQNDFSFELYPNPSNEWVRLTSPVPATYRLLSAEGKMVETGNLSAGNNQLKLNKFPNGLYQIQLITASGLVTVQRIVVQH